FFLLLVFRDRAESQRDKAIHGYFEALIELAVNRADIEDAGDFAPGEGNGLREILAEGEDTERDKDIQILFGGKTEFIVSLHLPGNLEFGTVGEHLGSAQFDFANAFSYATFEDSEGNGCQVFFFYREVEQRRLGVYPGHWNLPLCFNRDATFPVWIYGEAYRETGNFMIKHTGTTATDHVHGFSNREVP